MKSDDTGLTNIYEIIAAKRDLGGALRVLDVGCATGEFMGYLRSRMHSASFIGVDVTEDLLIAGRSLLPEAEFINASAIALPKFLAGFDVVCAMGCMSIFDETQIEVFWDNLIGASKPGGLVIVLAPLNEFGVDAMIRHRKRRDGVPGDWETGWNIFATETIRDLLLTRGLKLHLQRFHIPFDLPRKVDPIRTWTFSTTERERQLTNGLKLLIDHYFMICET